MPDNPQIPNPTARRRHLIPRSMPLSMMRAVYPTIQRTGRPKFTICGNPTGLTARKMSGGALGSGQRPADPRVRLATQRTDTSPPSPRRTPDRAPPATAPRLASGLAWNSVTRAGYTHGGGTVGKPTRSGRRPALSWTSRCPCRLCARASRWRLRRRLDPPGGSSPTRPARCSPAQSLRAPRTLSRWSAPASARWMPCRSSAAWFGGAGHG